MDLLVIFGAHCVRDTVRKEAPDKTKHDPLATKGSAVTDLVVAYK